jgi:hypothetical protein
MRAGLRSHNDEERRHDGEERLVGFSTGKDDA